MFLLLWGSGQTFFGKHETRSFSFVLIIDFKILFSHTHTRSKNNPPPKKKPIKTKFFQKLGKLASETVDNPRNTGRKGPGLEVTCVP